MKKLSKKGFTLAELLIVVAIIGVLVAISIPIFTAQKKKAILAVNQANARAAYAAACAEINSNPPDQSNNPQKYRHYYYLYDNSTGTIVQDDWYSISIFSDGSDGLRCPITYNGASFTFMIGGRSKIGPWGNYYAPFGMNNDPSSWNIDTYTYNPALVHLSSAYQKISDRIWKYWIVDFKVGEDSVPVFYNYACGTNDHK